MFTKLFDKVNASVTIDDLKGSKSWPQFASALYQVVNETKIFLRERRSSINTFNKTVEETFRKMYIAEGNMTDHAKRELELAGLFDKDSDYDGMLGEATLALMELFGTQGHSGFSAGLVRELFSRLSNYETLTEITNDPDEWEDVSEQMGQPTWQCRRNPSALSSDGGKTYTDYNDDCWHHIDEDGVSFSGNPEEYGKVTTVHTSKIMEKEKD